MSHTEIGKVIEKLKCHDYYVILLQMRFYIFSKDILLITQWPLILKSFLITDSVFLNSDFHRICKPHLFQLVMLTLFILVDDGFGYAIFVVTYLH